MINTEFEKRKIEMAEEELQNSDKELKILFDEYEKKRTSFLKELALYYEKRAVHLKVK